MRVLSRASFALPLYLVGSRPLDSCIFIDQAHFGSPKVGKFWCKIGWFRKVAKTLPNNRP